MQYIYMLNTMSTLLYKSILNEILINVLYNYFVHFSYEITTLVPKRFRKVT